MKTRTITATIISLAICASLVQAEDIGKVTIPTTVKTAGQLISIGTYTVAISQDGDELMIHLKQNGTAVVSEIAVTKPADKNHSTARINYQTLKRDGADDPLLSRVSCSYRGTMYYLYFEKP